MTDFTVSFLLRLPAEIKGPAAELQIRNKFHKREKKCAGRKRHDLTLTGKVSARLEK